VNTYHLLKFLHYVYNMHIHTLCVGVCARTHTHTRTHACMHALVHPAHKLKTGLLA